MTGAYPQIIDPLDELYSYSKEDEQALVNAAPWKEEYVNEDLMASLPMLEVI